MRRVFLLMLCLIVIVCAVNPRAYANSWGLKGELLDAVSSVKTWNDYSNNSTQIDNMAIMSSRYHNAVFYLDNNNKLNVFTKAVYQPASKKSNNVDLKSENSNIRIYYDENEWYNFCYKEEEWILNAAKFGDFELEGEAYYYKTKDNKDNAIWNAKIALSNFNIKLFPHSVEEVIHSNFMREALESGSYILNSDKNDYNFFIDKSKKHKTEVYSAPFGKSAWRAAKGKAAVSLNGGLWFFGPYIKNDTGSFACIRYDVSERTQRIGYIESNKLGDFLSKWQYNNDEFINVYLITTKESYLTDDPDVSQYKQFIIPEGTQFTCLAIYNYEYAYVSAEVKGDKFVDGGEIVWGFVPLKDLQFDDFNNHEEALFDFMANFKGIWVMDAGGTMAEDALWLNADGTYRAGFINKNSTFIINGEGNWYISPYKSHENLYWNNPVYKITFLKNNGIANIKGFSYIENGISFTNVEGGGGYIPFDGTINNIEYFNENETQYDTNG
ncbi:MAG: hypothetical protein GYA87_00895 [Christensenellaceae bacterium]|nr:hypothetical protein [Christensenellaceae bacterium]